MSRRAGSRPAYSLSELLVAVALLAVVGVALLTLLSSGAQQSARASELELATVVGARVLDRVLAVGYVTNATRAPADVALDLSRIGEPEDTSASNPQALIADGFIYGARCQLEQLSPGLLKVAVTLAWERHGTGGPRKPGKLRLVRLVADPTASLTARGRLGNSP